jgi:hypothetical protein
MIKISRAFLACFGVVICCSCNSDKPSSEAGVSGMRSEDLVGKWKLVKADGRPLGELSLKLQEIDLAADGTWASNIAFGGQMDGMTMKGGGKWSLDGGVINYTNGQESGKSKVTMNGGKLTLDPDFHLRKNDGSKAPLVGEYER